MPQICFSEEEIVDSGTATINGRGAAYIAKKHIGSKIRWLIIDSDQVTK